jgi:hypothetical protein
MVFDWDEWVKLGSSRLVLRKRLGGLPGEKSFSQRTHHRLNSSISSSIASLVGSIVFRLIDNSASDTVVHVTNCDDPVRPEHLVDC